MGSQPSSQGKSHTRCPRYAPPHFPRKSVGIEVKVALEDIKSDTQEDILPIQE